MTRKIKLGFAMLLSFMLDKYKSGVALLKQGNNGSFQKISSIVKLGTYGKPLSYTPTICP